MKYDVRRNYDWNNEMRTEKTTRVSNEGDALS